MATGVAWIRLGGDAVKVAVAVVGDAESEAVDAVYRAKYGEAGARSMITDESRRSTLRLDRGG